MLSVELRACSSHVVLRLRGELDAVSASDAVAAMTTIMPAGRCVIVDLAELEFADCAALNGLREVQNLARQGGRRYVARRAVGDCSAALDAD